ncbi:LysR family transcriptional regulator [Candidimonas sp. SYP-B2681]|uniref:LysR substrate-binding domain-containing protein n=1 Tax=Candidimonas sp. SYP-B2681 TaxID=2497686 RepID=UPI000F87D560|nr:LysR substrate-binding domain-containing protein [Candidimonas sp. SYP-B2681]RTZ41688.1 LysR family transcriptional regulator [Candidimonas sp. SYP-B2681]
MKDHQLKALVQVSESGSIRAAARLMNLSQSALTKALRELEEDVGAELLLRSYKGIEFTPAGRVLLTQARYALSALSRARNEIHLLQGGVGACVAVAITPMVAVVALPQVLETYQASYPDAELRLTEGFLTHIIPALVEGQIDFAIAIADPNDLPHEISFQQIAEVNGAVAGRVGHPLISARSWEDLAQARWVMNISAGSHAQNLVEWLVQAGHGAPAHVVNCNSPMMMTEMMRRTDLLGFAPEPLLQDAKFSLGMKQIAGLPMPPPMALGLLHLRGVPLSTAAKPLASLFVRHLSPAG